MWERPDILAHRVGFAHDHDAFRLKNAASWEIVVNFDRHYVGP